MCATSTPTALARAHSLDLRVCGSRWGTVCNVGVPSRNALRRSAADKWIDLRGVRVVASSVEGVASEHDSSSSSDSNTRRAPLLQALAQRGAVNDAPFYVPGHKRGRGVPLEGVEVIGKTALAHDLTELDGLDMLSSATGVIGEAQLLAAEAFGAKQTWFLVNGTSGGIHATLLATKAERRGDSSVQDEPLVLMSRNCHLSVFSGLSLSGSRPEYIMPKYDEEWGLAQGVLASDVEAALDNLQAKNGSKRSPPCDAVVIVSPTYFGVCSDVRAIADVCHSFDVPLIVDEAHGGHLHFHPELPASALSSGADIAIQSTHKVLGAMTQASMLHYQGDLVDPQKISRALQILQSSSPSYILMASLEAARLHVSPNGRSPPPEGSCVIAAAVSLAFQARDRLSRVPGVDIFPLDANSTLGICAVDPLRITVGVVELGLTGFGVSELLEQHPLCVTPELATKACVVFVLTAGNIQQDIDSLVAAFESISASHWTNEKHPKNDSTFHAPMLKPEQRVTPRDAFFAKSETVSASTAVGRISAELISAYPPGIPQVAPGEVFSEEVVEQLREVKKQGGYIAGAADESLETLRVLL